MIIRDNARMINAVLSARYTTDKIYRAVFNVKI